ncbi:MAG: hypothetical protein NTU62_01105 [Spirochaetes bacterium]|nr:hypothetical protein [Spirochaetota bacterium]
MSDRDGSTILSFQGCVADQPAREELEASGLYDKVTQDIGRASTQFQAWFDGTSRK